MATQAVSVATVTPGYVAWLLRVAIDPETFLNPRYGTPWKPHADLVRELFGNPFRPIAIDPRWQTSTVLDLARLIYDERAFDRLPILADALMDSGCDNDDVLSHCRGEGPHVRGCWVVDLLLGKK
jgi:hypothetical protein